MKKAAQAGGLGVSCGSGGFVWVRVSDPDRPSRARLPDLIPHRMSVIIPNIPARLPLGPAVKNNWLTPPFFPAPSPNPIPHN